MKLGVFLDLRRPSFSPIPAPTHYRRAIDFVVQSEAFGADSVWLSEHHFFSDGYLPQPLVLAAALAARTERLRIGTAITLPALRNPLHVAEEAAVVDNISGGRLELGFGAGWSEQEYARFGVEFRRRYSLTDAAFAEVRALLVGGGVTPAPIQQPVPMWLGYQGPQGATRAGRLGAGLLCLDRTIYSHYLHGLAEAGHPPEVARIGGVVNLVVADEPDSVIPHILPFLAHQQSTYARGRKGLPPDEGGNVEASRRLREAYDQTGELPGLAVLRPADAVAHLSRMCEGLPVEHLYFWGTIAGMPEPIALRHVELLMTQVKPHLA